MVLTSTTFKSLETLVKKLAVGHFKSISTIDYQIDAPLRDKEIIEILEVIEKYVSPNNLPDIKKGIDELLKCSENFFKTNRSHYIVYKNDVDGNKKIWIPIVYDLLLTIFFNTTQLERQYYFYKLIESYYNNNIDDKNVLISKEEFDDEIMQYMPYVKLQMIIYLSKIKAGKTKILESVSELIELILYPNIQREECYKIVSKKLGTEDYEFLKYEANALDERPGFLGDYYKIRIFIKINGLEETIYCFAKYLPTSNETTATVAKASFSKEIFFYKDFIPAVERLGVKGITDFLPKYYLSKPQEYIILEDITTLNYTGTSITESIEYDCLVLVIKQLAKLHACSFIYEDKMMKKTGKKVCLGDIYKPFLKEYAVSKTEIEGAVLYNGTKITVSYLLDKFMINEDCNINELKEKTKKANDKLFTDVLESKIYKNVICHGDLWGGNILTKPDENNKPHYCCLVDYQIVRYCSPLFDVLFMLYMNSNKSTRNKYYQEFLDIYYSELKTHLENNEVKIDDFYDYNTFLEACNYYKISAICLTLSYVQVVKLPKVIMNTILMDGEKSTEFFVGDRTDVLEMAFTHEYFYCKIKETIEDLCDELKKNKTL